MPTKWSEVFHSTGACEWCCALHHLRGTQLRSCEALIEGAWKPAFHIKERFTDSKQREHQVLIADTRSTYFVTQNEVRFQIVAL